MRQTPHFGKRNKTVPPSTEGENAPGVHITPQSKPKRTTLVVWCADDDKENIPPGEFLNLKNKQASVDSPVLLRQLSNLNH